MAWGRVSIGPDMDGPVRIAAVPGAYAQADPDPADVARIVVTTLVDAAGKGDADAQRGLYDLHARSAHAVARRIVGNGVDAEDVVQDAFAEAFLRLRELRKPQSFGPWLYRMVRNRAIDTLRSRRGLPWDPAELPEGDRNAVGGGSVPADVVVSDRETLEAVAVALESLTEADAKAVRLGAAEVDGKELAVELDVTDRAHAYVKLNRARGRLRQATGAVMLARHASRCPELRRRVREAGESASDVVRAVNRHTRACEECAKRQALLLESPQMAHALEPYGASRPRSVCVRRRLTSASRRLWVPVAVVAAILLLSVGVAEEHQDGEAVAEAAAPVEAVEPSGVASDGSSVDLVAVTRDAGPRVGDSVPGPGGGTITPDDAPGTGGAATAPPAAAEAGPQVAVAGVDGTGSQTASGSSSGSTSGSSTESGATTYTPPPPPAPPASSTITTAPPETTAARTVTASTPTKVTVVTAPPPKPSPSATSVTVSAPTSASGGSSVTSGK